MKNAKVHSMFRFKFTSYMNRYKFEGSGHSGKIIVGHTMINVDPEDQLPRILFSLLLSVICIACFSYSYTKLVSIRLRKSFIFFFAECESQHIFINNRNFQDYKLMISLIMYSGLSV